MKLKSELRITDRRVAADEPVYVIGEMACGHQGNVEIALALVDSAVAANADCVQLQIFEPNANMVPSAPTFPLLQDLFIDADKWRQIVTYARQFDIHVSIFAYDEPSLELGLTLEPDMLKLNSSELSNPTMLVVAAQSGLPFTLGTGASSIDEIRRAVELVISNGGENLILMHGVQNFPTALEDANLRKIRRLKDEFGGLVIYADHTDANHHLSQYIDMVAISMGAELVEKHLILDRSKRGVDSQAALEPKEFKRYVETIRSSWAALGNYDFQPLTDNEKKYRRFQKKSLVANRKMSAGEVIQPSDVNYLRVQSEMEGIAPIDFESKAQGKRLVQDKERFEQILLEDLY